MIAPRGAPAGRDGPIYLCLGVVTWVALFKSGVDPIVVGLAMGLLTYAYPAERDDLERATRPVPPSSASSPRPSWPGRRAPGLESAISPNERLQQRFHPWTSYVIVPLFALANAGIALDGDFLHARSRSPITLGILVGYIVGKPLGIAGDRVDRSTR